MLLLYGQCHSCLPISDLFSVFYVVWKSRASPTARGRLSLRVTLDDFPDVKFDKPARGAWWRHLLGRDNATGGLPALDVSSGAIRQDFSSDVPRSYSIQEQSAAARLRKPAGNGVFNSSRHDISDPILEQPLHRIVEPGAPYHPPTSFLRLIPRMELFHKVMKDEVRSLNPSMSRSCAHYSTVILHHNHHRDHSHPCPFTCLWGQL